MTVAHAVKIGSVLSSVSIFLGTKTKLPGKYIRVGERPETRLPFLPSGEKDRDFSFVGIILETAGLSDIITFTRPFLVQDRGRNKDFTPNIHNIFKKSDVDRVVRIQHHIIPRRRVRYCIVEVDGDKVVIVHFHSRGIGREIRKKCRRVPRLPQEDGSAEVCAFPEAALHA